MERMGVLPSSTKCLVKILWSKIFQVERNDPRGSIDPIVQMFKVSSLVFMGVVQFRRRFSSASTD